MGLSLWIAPGLRQPAVLTQGGPHRTDTRIEHIEEEIKGLNEGKKEVYAEAKGEGFDTKVLREVVRLKKQDREERDEHESLLDTYMHAIETATQPVAEAA
jgi:uncharacterized protein (UPF0335 family)